MWSVDSAPGLDPTPGSFIEVHDGSPVRCCKLTDSLALFFNSIGATGFGKQVPSEGRKALMHMIQIQKMMVQIQARDQLQL